MTWMASICRSGPVILHHIIVDYITLLCFFSIAPFIDYNYLLVSLFTSILCIAHIRQQSYEQSLGNFGTHGILNVFRIPVLNNNILKEQMNLVSGLLILSPSQDELKNRNKLKQCKCAYKLMVVVFSSLARAHNFHQNLSEY